MKKVLVLSLLLVSSICFGANSSKQTQQKQTTHKQGQQQTTCKCLTCCPNRCPPGSSPAEKELAISKKMSSMQKYLQMKGKIQ